MVQSRARAGHDHLEGQPLADATVTFLLADNSGSLVGRTDSAGRYSLTTFEAGRRSDSRRIRRPGRQVRGTARRSRGRRDAAAEESDPREVCVGRTFRLESHRCRRRRQHLRLRSRITHPLTPRGGDWVYSARFDALRAALTILPARAQRPRGKSHCPVALPPARKTGFSGRIPTSAAFCIIFSRSSTRANSTPAA